MFCAFFYLLRARGLAVSLSEWITLVEALDRGLAENSFFRFYYLCRAILVKSEADFDTFDGAFLEFFKDVKLIEELPTELLQWLEKPNHQKGAPDLERAEENRFLSNRRIREMLKERLAEQTSEHNGGSYWIGTHGVSVFGNDGYSPKGIRIGGRPQHRTAMEVAGERKFRDFRDDQVLDARHFQVAFRSLRQFSTRVNVQKTELSVDATIQKTANNAGRLELVYQKPRKNTVKLLLLMDSGGSMEEYAHLMAALFQAVNKSDHFSDLKVYYFHNMIRGNLYKSPVFRYEERVRTSWVLNNLDSSYKVMMIGDALMDKGDLYDTYRIGDELIPSGIEMLRSFRARYPHIVWLTPENMEHYTNSYWGASLGIIREEIDMYELTKTGLEAAIKKLLVRT